MEELDKILQKFTSQLDIPNALKGASFTAFTKDGTYKTPLWPLSCFLHAKSVIAHSLKSLLS